MVQKACIIGAPEGWREYNGSHIWKDNRWEFPKTEEKHQVTDSVFNE